MFRKINFIGLILLFMQGVSVQAQVWPGDVNNNGIVNHIDLLYFSEVFLQNGPPRQPGEEGIEWEEKAVDVPWAGNFSNGVNHGFADCDGDGFILFDNEAIVENFGLTHGVVTPDVFTPGVEGDDIPLTMGLINGVLFENSAALMFLYLGGPGMDVNDLTGLAFSLKYDPDVFVDTAIDFSIGDWISSGAGMVLDVVENNPDEGRIDVALTRLDTGPVGLSGNGDVGLFFIVIEDNVVGLTETIESSISIENVKLIEKGFVETPVYADSVTLVISGENVVSTNTPIEEESIRVYPQPAGSFLWVDAPDHLVNRLEIIDVAGRTVLGQSFDRHQGALRLETDHLKAGFYLLKILTEQGWVTRKVTVQP